MTCVLVPFHRPPPRPDRVRVLSQLGRPMACFLFAALPFPQRPQTLATDSGHMYRLLTLRSPACRVKDAELSHPRATLHFAFPFVDGRPRYLQSLQVRRDSSPSLFGPEARPCTEDVASALSMSSVPRAVASLASIFLPSLARRVGQRSYGVMSGSAKLKPAARVSSRGQDVW